jgi:monoterpene epsilon-lactone hydrolase
LTLSGASWTSRAEADPYFTISQAREQADAYLAGRNASDAQASPLFACLAGLPPLRIHVGDDEVLVDDSLRYVERAQAEGVDAHVHVWLGLPHVFLSGVGQLVAADEALADVGAFIAGRLKMAA